MKKIILVVDDISDNVTLLKNILELHNYTVRAALNGQNALAAARMKPHPDIILLDVMMPGMSGFEVCTKLKEDPETMNIPVIFVTAKGDIEDEADGFRYGAVDYIKKPVSAPVVLARVKTHLSLIRTEQLEQLATAAISMLAEAGHYNDQDTGMHIWRMAGYASRIAREAGWHPEQAKILEYAATMHDTGKIGIPDSILKAPRKLTAREWDIMKAHTTIGCEILNKSANPLFQTASVIAMSHHEKWDGSGYPEGLSGENIPVEARIVAVADVFDALTSKRPYKEAWPIEEAFAEIEKSKGTHFDPFYVDIFFSIRDDIIKIKNEKDAQETEYGLF